MPELGDGSRGVEHDPEEIWNNTARVIESVISDRKIVAVGIANQGESSLLWNRKTGAPLHNALVWQDRRTQRWMDELKTDSNLRKKVSEKTGLHLDAYFSASKIRWLLDHAKGARELLRDGNLCAGTFDTWLIYKLTGGKSFVTDPSTASRTLLYNIHEKKFDPELLELFGVPEGILAEVLDGGFGTVSAIPKIDGVPIAASLVDQAGAVFGQGCLHPGDVKATYGTGCFVYMNCGTEPSLNKNGILSTIAWSRNHRFTYALDGGIFAAGSVLEYLSGKLGLLKDMSDLDRILREVPSTGSVVCVPAFAGLASPYWKRNARAAFLGLDLATSKSVLIRAALEGVASRVAQVIRAMKQSSSFEINRIRVDGGMVRSDEFVQIQADFLGIPIEVPENREATVMGVCYLAARFSGLWKSDEDVLKSVRVSRIFQPKLNAHSRETALSRFDSACELVAKWEPDVVI